MYIHSTDSSCEKTKQEKQKNFSILLLRKQKKNPEKTKTARWKKLPHSPLKWKKRNFDFDIMCHQFLHAFCLFCHVLPHTTTTIYYSEKNKKKSSKLLRFSLILFLIIQKLFLCFRKNCRKMLTMKGNQKVFPFLIPHSPMFHVNCEWWCWMDEIKFFFDT